MFWLPIALVAPFCWAIVNHIDKYLLDKHLDGKGSGVLVVYSSLFGIFLLPFAIFFDPSLFNTSAVDIAILISAGIFMGLAFFLYLRALSGHETSFISPIAQSIPFFGFIFAFFILNEVLSLEQIIGGLTVLAGSFILSLEIKEERRFSFRWKPYALMLAHSALFGIHDVLFKFSSERAGSFWAGTFWSNLGLLLFGVAILFFSKETRSGFILSLFKSKSKVVLLNLGSEVLTAIGTLSFTWAILLAPVSLVQVANGYQPFFVFIFGIFMTIFFPKILTEKISLKHLVHKTVALLIVLFGSFMVYN